MSLPATPTLPDFRSFGVVLRCLLLAEGLQLGAVLVFEANLTAALGRLVQQGVLFEPVLLTALGILYVLHPWLSGRRYRWGLVLVLGVVGLTTAAWHAGVQALADHKLKESIAQQLLAASGVTGALLFYFNWRQLRLAPGLADARLMALQARIRPHFLFNSLNSVLALIRDDPKRAEVMLENLSDVFRAVLSDSRALVPLEQEIELAQAYLSIEEIRLGARLQVEWHLDHAPLGTMVPPLVLQPLLENAVIHGISLRPEGGLIRVEAFEDSGDLVLFVSNPKPQGDSTANGSHMAIQNIKERLDLHFDVEARLKVTESESDFLVHVRVPVRKKSVAGI